MSKHKLGILPPLFDETSSAYIEGFKQIAALKYKEDSLFPQPKWMKTAKFVEVRTEPKIQRNDLCPCGSGKKYKKCCEK